MCWSKSNKHKHTFLGYLFQKISKNFDDARQDCFTRGGDLASINSPEEQALIIAESEKICTPEEKCQWQLGLLRDQDKWKWLDGTIATYTDWLNDGYPKEHHNCVILNWLQKWQSSACGQYNVAPYVCEYKGERFYTFL